MMVRCHYPLRSFRILTCWTYRSDSWDWFSGQMYWNKREAFCWTIGCLLSSWHEDCSQTKLTKRCSYDASVPIQVFTDFTKPLKRCQTIKSPKPPQSSNGPTYSPPRAHCEGEKKTWNLHTIKSKRDKAQWSLSLHLRSSPRLAENRKDQLSLY